MEIKREIIKEDLPQIEALLNTVFGSPDYISVERMGGLTNHSYHIIREDQKHYAIRLPGEGTEAVIIRDDERISTKLACDLDIDAKLLYFSNDGKKVSEYIPDAVTMTEESMREEKHIAQAAAIFRKLHHCSVDTGVPFRVFDMAATYEKVISENNVPMPEDYPETKKTVMAVKNEVDALFHTPEVPCHNDPLCANWVEGNGRLYLIDWEYAGMNDGMWDLAALSIEAQFGEEQDQYMLEQYLGEKPDRDHKKHLIASKIFVDYLWSLWAKMRVPYDGQPMEDWAAERYARMMGFIETYQNI
ncbi:MAG: phosphotransferase family protein [Anaerolineaceae bacterium]|nr:phosphotransferase family protein [Anaerolineaceae bacterium]